MRKFLVRISMVAFILVSLSSCIDDGADIVPADIITTNTGDPDEPECKDNCG